MIRRNSLSRKLASGRYPRVKTTLMDIIRIPNSVSHDDELVVAAAAHLVNTKQTRLAGNSSYRRIVVE